MRIIIRMFEELFANAFFHKYTFCGRRLQDRKIKAVAHYHFPVRCTELPHLPLQIMELVLWLL